MKAEDIQIGSVYWTSFFLEFIQGKSAPWRVVAVKVVSKITREFLVGDKKESRISFECKCEGYDRPRAIPAVYWEGGTPAEFMKDYEYGSWPNNRRTFTADELYPDAESCVEHMYKRFSETADNLHNELASGSFKDFTGDLIIGVVAQAEDQQA